MTYTIYQDSLTHKFALLALSARSVGRDRLPVVETDRWYDSCQEAIAALSDLLNREDSETDVESDDIARN
jgi:hypothetical protein